MMWTLILTTVLHSPYYRQSSAISTTNVPYFLSEEACKAAGYTAPKPSDGQQEYKVEVIWACVPMGEDK